VKRKGVKAILRTPRNEKTWARRGRASGTYIFDIMLVAKDMPPIAWPPFFGLELHFGNLLPLYYFGKLL
jgi:hypothetical protein